MDPNQFYFLILPLASLVFILVIVVVYYARKENNKELIEMQLLDELIRTGAVNRVNFATALQDLFEGKIIDKESFRRMGQFLEEHLSQSEEEQRQDKIRQHERNRHYIRTE